jgi:DNA replication protein DnaC
MEFTSGTEEFKKQIQAVNERIAKSGAMKPRPQDPFKEEDWQYFDYLTECGFDPNEFMTASALGRVDAQRKAVEEKRKAVAAAQALAELECKLRFANVSEMHKGCTFENYKISTDKQRKFVEVLRTDKKTWFKFLGNTGTGKNHLAAAMIRQRISEGKTAEIWRAKRLMDNLLGETLDEKKRVLRRLESLDLLILDEMGRCSEKKFFKDTFFDLLVERHESLRQTVFISNLSEDDLLALFEDAPYNSLQRKLEYTTNLHFDWPAFGHENDLPGIEAEAKK